MADEYNANQEWLDFLGTIDATTPGYDFLSQFTDAGKLQGWGNLNPQALQTLGTYGIATSSKPETSAVYSFNALNQGLWDTYGPAAGLGGGFAYLDQREKTRRSNLAAKMLGYEDTAAAKQAGVQDTYGKYLEGILGDAEAMKQDTQRMETIADQVEMGMLDFTPGEDWE